jgi:hypothetical protein
MTNAAPPLSGTSICSTIGQLESSDPAVADRDELATLVATSARLRAWLDAYDVRCARRNTELADTGRSEPTASMFARNGQQSSKDANRINDRQQVCDQLDEFEAALSDGRISTGHLDGVAAAIRNLDDDTRLEFIDAQPELLHAAVGNTVDGFARQCRDLARHLTANRAASDADELDRQRANVTVKHWIDKITGMCHTHLELDPLRDAAVWSGINAQLARLCTTDGNATTPWNQLQADAVVAATSLGATRSRSTPPAGATSVADDEADDTAHALRVPEVTLLVDLRTLTDGMHDHSICETEDGIPLPVSTVRRLCCDAEIIPAVLGTDGVPLDLGRSVRTATRAQRRALRSMHRTCAHPDCTVPFSACKAHHIRWWWKHNGRTDISNLLPLCERHHHLVHEGGWGLTMTPDRVATWTRPDGTVHHTGTTIDRHPSPPVGLDRNRNRSRSRSRDRGASGADHPQPIRA